MSVISCPIPECSFKLGQEIPDVCKNNLLKLHVIHHQSEYKTELAEYEPPKRPKLTPNNTDEEWNRFISKWNNYKKAAKLAPSSITFELIECCVRALKNDLIKVHGNSYYLLDEGDLLNAIKREAVLEERSLVSRFNLHSMKQEDNEPVRKFVNRIKNQAHICKLKVPCPSCNFAEVDYSDEIIRDVVARGINDESIRVNLLCDRNRDMSLEDTIAYIEALEKNKQAASQRLRNGASTVSASQPQPQQSYAKKCPQCGQVVDYVGRNCPVCSLIDLF